jgi:hypothetical protein
MIVIWLAMVLKTMYAYFGVILPLEVFIQIARQWMGM